MSEGGIVLKEPFISKIEKIVSGVKREFPTIKGGVTVEAPYGSDDELMVKYLVGEVSSFYSKGGSQKGHNWLSLLAHHGDEDWAQTLYIHYAKSIYRKRTLEYGFVGKQKLHAYLGVSSKREKEKKKYEIIGVMGGDEYLRTVQKEGQLDLLLTYCSSSQEGSLSQTKPIDPQAMYDEEQHLKRMKQALVLLKKGRRLTPFVREQIPQELADRIEAQNNNPLGTSPQERHRTEKMIKEMLSDAVIRLNEITIKPIDTGSF